MLLMNQPPWSEGEAQRSPTFTEFHDFRFPRKPVKENLSREHIFAA